MFPSTSGGYSFTLALDDEQATHRLMVDIIAAFDLRPRLTLRG